MHSWKYEQEQFKKLKETKGRHTGKEDIKLSLFANKMIFIKKYLKTLSDTTTRANNWIKISEDKVNMQNNNNKKTNPQ